MKIIIHCAHRTGSTSFSYLVANQFNIKNLVEPYNMDDGAFVYDDDLDKQFTNMDLITCKFNAFEVLKKSTKSFVCKIIPTQFIEIYDKNKVFSDEFQHWFFYRQDIVDQILSLGLALSTNTYNTKLEYTPKPFKLNKNIIDFMIKEDVALRDAYHNYNNFVNVNEYSKVEYENALYKKLCSKEAKISLCSNYSEIVEYMYDALNSHGFTSGKFFPDQ